MDLVEENKVVSIFGGEITPEHIFDNEDDFGGKVDINKVLDGAKDLGLEELVLIGRHSDGRFYFASTSGNAAQVVFDLESAKHILITSSFPNLFE
jgi:hypothetical protein